MREDANAVLIRIVIIGGCLLLALMLWIGFDGPRRDRIRKADGFAPVNLPAPEWRWENFRDETDWHRDWKKKVGN